MKTIVLDLKNTWGHDYYIEAVSRRKMRRLIKSGRAVKSNVYCIDYWDDNGLWMEQRTSLVSPSLPERGHYVIPIHEILKFKDTTVMNVLKCIDGMYTLELDDIMEMEHFTVYRKFDTVNEAMRFKLAL